MSAIPGQGWCCCPDCRMFLDHFDCCWSDPRQPWTFFPKCDNLGRDEMYPADPLPCCLDQDYWDVAQGKYILNTLPMQDLGIKWDWENASGDWWKAISPDMRYSVYNDICNDGALWALSPGTMTCRMGWINDGYAFNIDIVEVLADTNFTITFFDPGDETGTGTGTGTYDPSNTLTVTFAITGEDASNYTGTLSAGGESIPITVPKTSPMNPTNRQTLYVNINKVENITCISLNTFPSSLADIVLCSSAGGHKFSITNSGSIAAFDDVYWGKYYVYPGQEFPACPNCHKCYCFQQVGDKLRTRAYGGWHLHIYGSCVICPPSGNPCTWEIEAGFTEYSDCAVTGNLWYSPLYEASGTGTGSRWFYWRINCIANAITFTELHWVPGVGGGDPDSAYPYTGNGNWEPTVGGTFALVAPIDCRNYINRYEFPVETDLSSHFGLTCQNGYHIWEDDGTGVEPAIP